MANIKVPDLPATSSLNATDLFVIDTGSVTQKITFGNLRSNLSAAFMRVDINITPTPSDISADLYVGTIFADAGDVAGLPTATAGHYYRVLCFGRVQIALRYLNTTTPSSPVWFRQYANNVWLPWGGVSLSANP